MKTGKRWCGTAALWCGLALAAPADNPIQWGVSTNNWFDHTGAPMQAGTNGASGWLVQLVYAGGNGAIDPPTGVGTGVSGDDAVVAWGYFDSANWGGRFVGPEYINSQPNGAKYYFRAWEGVTSGNGQVPLNAGFHGESMLFTGAGNGAIPLPDVFEPNTDLGGAGGLYAMKADLVATATLVVQADPGGRVTGGGLYVVNSNAAISATASNLWWFTGWNDGSSAATRSVLVPAGGATYIANFALAGAVTLQANDPNGGTVTGGGICPVGVPIPIAAKPNMGWRFLNWSDGNTNRTRSIIVGDPGISLTANFMPAPTYVLLQAGDGGAAGRWTLGTNYLPAAWTPVTGALGSHWVLRAMNQDRILLQQGAGGAISLWSLTNGAPARTWSVSGALPGWIARDLDGNRVLLQNGDGGMVGLWTLNASNQPVAWNAIAPAASGQIARALREDRVLVQYGASSAMGYWTLNSSNNITAWSLIANTLPSGWIARAMNRDYILLQYGDGGATGMWDLDANGQPTAWHNVAAAVPGWVLRGMDQAVPALLTVAAGTNSGGTVTGGGAYFAGATVTLTATPSNGWAFVGWNDGNTNATRQVAVPAGGAAYTASFAPGVTLTLLSNPPNTGIMTGEGTYLPGAQVAISTRPMAGWKFVNWSDGNTNAVRLYALGAANAILTANYTPSALKVLLQAGDGGLAGLWTLGTNYLPAAWSSVTGPLGSHWALRAIHQNRILLQQGNGGPISLWELTNNVPGRVWNVSGPVPGWIARDLDGNRILLQAGDGGAVGLWTLNASNVPVAWNALAATVPPGLVARALSGNTVLVQQGTAGRYWALNGANAVNGTMALNAPLPAGWILRSLTPNYILLQAGDGGAGGLWSLDAGGQPVEWHAISGPLPGWILRSLDEP